MDPIVGKIQSIYCENFVTYDKVTVTPGKYLNLILGPNGTGKSSLVAAIVLGLGGEPKLLSRASEIGEYVKNGKEKALIRITIYVDEEGTTSTYQRSFGRTGKSIHGVDNAVVTHAQYMKSIAKYNIQVSNLCQFMPQDRVQDFAKMNPQELLNSTQEAISTPEMIEKFNKLKELRIIQRDGDKTLTDNQKQLKELEDRNAQLQGVMEKMQIREKFLDDISIGEKKRLWLEFEAIQKDFANVKGIIKKARFELARDETIFKEVLSRSRNIISVRDGIDADIKNAAQVITQLSVQLDKLDESFCNHTNSIIVAERDLKSKKTQMAERDHEIHNANLLFEGYVQDLKNAMEACGTDFNEQLASYDATIETKKREILQLTEKRSDLNQEIDHYQPELNAIRNRMNKIQNEGERRLHKLRQIDHDAYMGVEWLKRNRNIFKGHVYDPMIVEVRVKNAKHAIYIENTIPKRDLLAFVCTEKSDMSLLIQKLCNEERLKVNVVHSNEAEHCRYKAQTTITNELKDYGFYSYLLDMIEGPVPILNYLCEACRIHKILVATDKVEQYVDNLPRSINFFYSSRNQFRITISRYTNQASSMSFQIKEKNLLSADIDERQLSDLNAQLKAITRKTDEFKNQRSAIEAKIDGCNEHINGIVQSKKKIEAKKLQIITKKRQVKFQEERLTQLRNSIIDIPQEEESFKINCQAIIGKILEIQTEKVKCLAEYQKMLETKQYNSVKLQIYRKETVDIENQLKLAEDDYRKAEKRVSTLEKTQQEVKAQLDSKENVALGHCDGKRPNDRKFPYKQEFQTLPDTLQELEERLIEMKTRAECLNEYTVDVAEYERRAKDIERIQLAINNSINQQEDLLTKMQKLHDTWYPYFSEKILAINKNFSRFMSLLEFVGEVNITHTNLNDYDTYGIQILVQYRNSAKLQALDRFVQSGGERAVAIALYSMSLQNLTHVPFRCVDEINQGMDPANERKVFNLIVDETCRIGSSQYFFVTPKLLPGLHCNELLTALIVFNGQLSSPDVFSRRI